MVFIFSKFFVYSLWIITLLKVKDINMSEPSYGDQINARLAKCNKLDGIMDMLNTINYEQAGTCLRGLPEVAQTKPCTFSSTRTNDMLTRCSLINQGNEDALTKPHTLLSSTSTNDELSRCSLTKQGNETAILPRFAGRYVSRMISASTLEISKRFVTPVFGQGDIRADLENFIRKLSNHRRLKNLLLVITPTSSKLADMWKLHCFAVDKQMHLGVTRLRSEERALIEKHHSQNNYHLMFCSQSLDLEDVSRATPIKKLIIESLQPDCPPLRTICYKGQQVALNYMLLEQAGTEPIIKSLQAPKIPVRYRRTDGIDRNDRLALVQQQRYSQDSYSSCSVLYSRHKKEHVSSPSHPSRTAPKTVLNSAQLDEQKRQLEKQKEMIPNELREEEVESTIRDLLKQMNLRNQSISPDRLVESPWARPQAKSKAVGPEQLESTISDVRKQMNLRNPSKSTDRRKCIVESPFAGPQAECKAVSQEPEQLIKKHIKIGYTTIIENIKVNLGNINLKDSKREPLIKSKQIESKPKKQTALKMPNEEKQKIESPTEDKIIVLKPIPPRDDIENEIRVDSKEKRVDAKESSDVMERIVNEQECKQSEKQRNDFKKTTTREPDLESMLEHTKQKAKEAKVVKISKVKEGQTGQKQDTEGKHLLAEQVELASAQAASTATIPSQTQTCKLRSLDDIIKQESPIIIKQPEPSSESMNLKISQGNSMSKIVASQPLKHDIPNKPVQEKQAEIRTPRMPNKQYVEVADLKEKMSTMAKQKKMVSKTSKDCITSKSRVAFKSWKKYQAGLKKPALESMLAYKKQKSREAQLAKITKEKGQIGQKQESEEKLLLAEQVELASAQAASQIQTCKLRFLDDIIKMESAVIKKQTAPSSESMNLQNSQGVAVSKLVASQTLEHDDPNEPLQAKQVEITSPRVSNKQHVKVADLKENMSTTAQQKKLVSKAPKDCMTSKSRVPLRSWKKQQVGLKKPALESMLAHKQNSKEAQLAKISKEKGQTAQKQESEREAQLAKISKEKGQRGQKQESAQKRLPTEQVEIANDILMMESTGNLNFQDSQGKSVSKPTANQHLNYDFPNKARQKKQVEIRSPRISNKQNVKVADIKESKSTMAKQKKIVSKTSKARVPLKSWKKKSVCCFKASSEKMTSSWPSMLASEKRKMSEKEERKKREIEKQRNRHALNALRAESLSARDKHLQKQHAVYHAYKEKARQDREQAKCYQELAQRRQFQRFLSQISNVEASSQCSAQVSEPVSSKKPRLAKPQFNTCIRPQKDLESLNSDPRKEFQIPQQLCYLTGTLRRLGHFEHLLKDHPPMENKSTQVGRASGDACRVKFVEPFELQANGNGIRFIWGPQELRKSQGRIKSQCYSMSLGCKHGSVYQNHCSIINQSSTSFEHIMSPVEVPSEYSMQARLLLRQKLRPLNLKLAFEKYGILIDCINRRPVPLDAHLMIFFQFVELLDLKLYVREEVYFPGFAPISQPKYRLECYIFDDRKDFFGSIALLATQLEQAIQQCPHLLHNLRHIDDAFYLTNLPQSLTSGLRHLFNFFRVRGLFSLLAELTYDWMQPPARVLALTQNQSQELEALICQKARDTRHKHLKED